MDQSYLSNCMIAQLLLLTAMLTTGQCYIKFSTMKKSSPSSNVACFHITLQSCRSPPTSGKSASTNVCACVLIASTRAPTMAMSDSMMLCFCSRSSTPIKCLPYSSDSRFTYQPHIHMLWPTMLKYGMQKDIMGPLQHAKYDSNRWRWVDTGAPKFQNFVKTAAFRQHFHLLRRAE